MNKNTARHVIFNYGCDIAYLSNPYARFNRIADSGWSALELCDHNDIDIIEAAKQVLAYYPSDIREQKRQAAAEKAEIL